MRTNEMLTAAHPSSGCKQAWFMFAVAAAGRVTRILLVEARNEAQVQVMERVSGSDGRPGPSCELLTVHRQCPSIGIRSDLVKEVRYVDFMIDVADPSRIVSDPVTARAFQDSLSPDDRERALRKMGSGGAEPDRAPAKVIPIRRPPFDPASSENYQDVVAALTDLGYKRPQAKKAVDALGRRVDELGLADAVKAALQGRRTV